MPERIFPHNIADLYRQAAEQYGDLPAVAARKKDGSFEPISYQELFEIGKNLATALIALGLQSREHVSIIANNRSEWILSDCAIQLAGAANVPRGTDSTKAEVKYILNHADTRFVFLENAAAWKKFHACLSPDTHVIMMEAFSPEGCETARQGGFLKENMELLHSVAALTKHSLQDLILQGAALRKLGDRRVEERMDQIQPEDLFTLIYTSGTTGIPKGVPLTHANAASQIRNLPFDLRSDDRAISILPVWHSYERVFELITLSWGVVFYYTSVHSIAEDLKRVRPTVMCSAPRLWEGLYRRIRLNLRSSSPLQRIMFRLAYGVAHRVKAAEAFFHGNTLDLKGRGFLDNAGLTILHTFCWLICFLPHCLLDSIVLKKIRAIVGGKFRGTISGGGALQTHVDEFFNFVGIPILEGYGLTETSPVLAVRTWEKLVIGTVGPIYPETEIRIIDLESGNILYPDPSRSDQGRGHFGEIHARGPQIMKGYYKDDTATSQVLHNGWLNTGDIGMITFNNCLKILGRSKDTIVLLNGENVEPSPIESILLNSPLIEQCMLVGQNQKYLGVLIVPSTEGFSSLGIQANGLKELSKNSEAVRLLNEEIHQIINQENSFKSFEHIVSWRIIPKPFEIGDELTQTLKLKRYVITKKYRALIREMFRIA